MYKASQNLVDILIENGFRNKSHQYVPDFGRKFGFQKPYDPGAYKRVYGFGQGKRKLEFYFNYINMVVTNGTKYITGEYIEIDECKLRSIIAYFKSSYTRQQTIQNTTNNQIELAGELMKKQRGMGWIHPPFDDAFEKLYNDVII